MVLIPQFPDSVAFSQLLLAELEPILLSLKDGLSELTFYSLLIHQEKHKYFVSRSKNGNYFLFRGNEFYVPLNGLPTKDEMQLLVAQNKKILLCGQSIVNKNQDLLDSLQIKMTKDMDNADYLYKRIELQELKGKAFHKKKNHLNSFVKNYEVSYSPLINETVNDAIEVLQEWYKTHSEIESDYETAKKALLLLPISDFFGQVVYINNKCVGFFLGEYMQEKTVFCTHFEKGLDQYRGIYQYLNNLASCTVGENVLYINREQDLGDEGLRQSKMTYRPCGFVEKYRQL